MDKILLYCRSGFEKECAAEIVDKAKQYDVYGSAQIKENTGYVLFECYKKSDADRLAYELPFNELIFSRQMIVVIGSLCKLSTADRITPIADILKDKMKKGGELRVEVPDTNETKKLLKFCRKFTVPLRISLCQKENLLECESEKRPVIHVFFITSVHCYIGYSYPTNNSPFFMGIPRLKFPSASPSRSTLKLEEAFRIFIPDHERNKRLAEGMYAVDLGACPGGWTYQLVKRNMIVYAVDNGLISPKLMNYRQVIHHRHDGFKYRPTHNNISWLLCDIVEKPARVSNLITKWIIKGWCRESIFNLKLPMKKRYEEVSKNLNTIQKKMQEKNINTQIQIRQLYHDREEVTVHIRRIL